MLENIDFKDGEITFDNLLWLTEKSFREDKEFLGEDLLQVSYFNNYVLDVGWYNISNKNGKFIIRGIKAMNWNTPLFEADAISLKELKRIIEVCIKVIHKDKMK